MSEELSSDRAKAEFAETMKKLKAQLRPELERISGDFFRRKAVEFVANRDAIRKTLREQRKRRGVKVSQSVLP